MAERYDQQSENRKSWLARHTEDRPGPGCWLVEAGGRIGSVSSGWYGVIARGMFNRGRSWVGVCREKHIVLREDTVKNRILRTGFPCGQSAASITLPALIRYCAMFALQGNSSSHDHSRDVTRRRDTAH